MGVKSDRWDLVRALHKLLIVEEIIDPNTPLGLSHIPFYLKAATNRVKKINELKAKRRSWTPESLKDNDD